MADIVRWTPFTQVHVLGARVYLKAGWFDQWSEIEHLHCTRATWSAAPGVSTAELSWRYGRGMRIGEAEFNVVYRQVPRQRWFVKIVIEKNIVPNHPLDDLVWYGTIEVEVDQLGGVKISQGPQGAPEAVSTGHQHFTCFGMEQLLSFSYVTSGRWMTEPTLEEYEIARGLTFNEGGKPNRSRLPGVPLCFLFSDTAELSRTWTTYDAVQYLLAVHSPRDWAGDQRIPFKLSLQHGIALPRWNAPILPTHGRTCRELLNQLIPRQRLLSYYLTVVEGPPASVQLIPFSFNDVDLVVAPGQSLSANVSQKILAFEGDRVMRCAVKRSSLDRIDYVEAVGAPRRDCFTLNIDEDETLAEKWIAAQETAYEAGASTAADFPAATEIERRQRRNVETRHNERLAVVFRRFGLADDWDGLVGDGIGGAKKPAAPKDDNVAQPYPLYKPLLRFLDTLPLLERHDYDANKIRDQAPLFAKTGNEPFDELRPMVLVPLPQETGKYQLIEKIGAAAHLEEVLGGSTRSWTGHVHVVPGTTTFELRIDGEPQHVIAKGRFAGRPEDEQTGDYDYREFIFTLAIEDPRNCRAQWPAQLPLGFDAVRGLRIEAGDGYKLDYVAPGTVVGLNPTTLEPVRSTSGGFVRDDRPLLEIACKLAYAWYQTTRKAVELSHGQVTKALWLGDLVIQVGDPGLAVVGDTQVQEVRSCVTEISVDMPIGINGPPPPRRIQWTTAFGELDPLGFVPR